MKLINLPASVLTFLAISVIRSAALAPTAYGQDAPPGSTSKDAAPLLRQMVGTWDVKQRTWPGADAEAVNLPPALARRRLVEGAFLEETMELTEKSEKASFTRVSYFNFNAVATKYEYFS